MSSRINNLEDIYACGQYLIWDSETDPIKCVQDLFTGNKFNGAITTYNGKQLLVPIDMATQPLEMVVWAIQPYMHLRGICGPYVPVVKVTSIKFADYPKSLCLGSSWFPFKGCPVDDGNDCDYQKSYNGFNAVFDKCAFSSDHKFQLIQSPSKNFQWHNVFAFPKSVLLRGVDISSSVGLSNIIVNDYDSDNIKLAYNQIVKISNPTLTKSGINLFFPSPRFFANSNPIDIKTIGATSGGPGDNTNEEQEREKQRQEREAQERAQREAEEKARELQEEEERLRQAQQSKGAYTSQFKEKLTDVSTNLSVVNDKPAEDKATALFSQITDVLKDSHFTAQNLTDLDKSIVVFTFILQNLSTILDWVNGAQGRVLEIVTTLDTNLDNVVNEVVTATRSA